MVSTLSYGNVKPPRGVCALSSGTLVRVGWEAWTLRPHCQFRSRCLLRSTGCANTANVGSDLGADAVAAFQEGHAVLSARYGRPHQQVLIQAVRPHTEVETTVTSLGDHGLLTSLLPVMDAQIGLRPNGAAHSHLTFTGRYHPAAAQHRSRRRPCSAAMAQATADAFLAKISTTLQLAGTSESAERADILGPRDNRRNQLPLVEANVADPDPTQRGALGRMWAVFRGCITVSRVVRGGPGLQRMQGFTSAGCFSFPF